MSRIILIVEDNDVFRGMLGSLISMRGYQVVTARDANEGLAIAATQPIDAALADVEMPGMDGFEFCRRVRALRKEAGQDLPVWIMTGLFRPALNKRASEAGALLVLRKPFHAEEFCARCEQEFKLRATTSAADDNLPESSG